VSTLSDFIRDGCSARPEDKVSALAEVAALEAELKEAYVMIGLCLTGHWPRPEAETLWQRLHDRYCGGSCVPPLREEETNG